MGNRLPISRASFLHQIPPTHPVHRGHQRRPPAEYGGKTSLVIVASTRSGQGVTKPTGSINTSYGAFGSASAGVDLAFGGKKWGNFVETTV